MKESTLDAYTRVEEEKGRRTIPRLSSIASIDYIFEYIIISVCITYYLQLIRFIIYRSRFINVLTNDNDFNWDGNRGNLIVTAENLSCIGKFDQDRPILTRY